MRSWTDQRALGRPQRPTLHPPRRPTPKMGARPPHEFSAALLDLYAELRAVTPDSLQPLLRDLFEEITLWNVRAETARVEPTGTGELRVTLAVTASNVRADSVGNETRVPTSSSTGSAATTS